MIVIIGILIVAASIVGGFTMGGGHVGTLLHASEFVIIGGAAIGAMVIMSPGKVLKDLFVGILGTVKGRVHHRRDYEELFKALYELFMLGRRNGMIAMEDHVLDPSASGIFQKYPAVLKHASALNMLCGGLRPIIDGKLKPEQLKMMLEIEMEAIEEEHHKPVNVLMKIGDSLPAFGIVAAVLGIVITMGSIAGPIEEIGKHVAAALVGTFLGILLAYGFVNPLAIKLEFNGHSELAYTRCAALAVIGYANGMAPGMALEMARRGLEDEVRPSSDDLEKMLKGVSLG